MMIVRVDPSDQAQTRRACDRCHRLKLRCSREYGETCQRCLRAKVECTSSLPEKSRRRKQNEVKSSNHTVQNIDINVASHSASQRTPTAPSISSGQLPTQPEEVRSNVITSDNDSFTSGSLMFWMMKVSNLNISLLEHLTLLSRLKETGGGGGEEPPPLQMTSLNIDKTFSLSQTFIDILGEICSRLPPLKKASHPDRNPNPLLATFSLDPASELLIFSNYLRLIEIYDTILRIIWIYIERSRSNPTTQYPFEISSLTIGIVSITPRSDTMHLVLINLLETMFIQVRTSINRLSSPKKTPGYRGDFDSFGGVALVIVPDLALQAIRIRENTVLRLLDQVKHIHLL